MSIEPRTQERRTSPRVNVTDRLRGHVTTLASDVIIRDLSLGGFLVESAEAFPADALHQFRVANDAGWTTLITAKSVHCRRVGSGSDARYLTGFAFVFPEGRSAYARVHELIDQVTSVLTF